MGEHPLQQRRSRNLLHEQHWAAEDVTTLFPKNRPRHRITEAMDKALRGEVVPALGDRTAAGE
jgi:hypothetical protein